MQASMMTMPLNISALLRHAARYHGDTEIVSRTVEGPIHRYDYAQALARAQQLANALARLGVQAGDRVATLAWNGYRHFELYYAVSGSGAITHTVNPRLFPEQVAWIVNHAEDGILFFDISFAPLVQQLAPQCPTVKHWIAMTGREQMPALNIPNLLCYEELLAAENDTYDWPKLDENLPAVLCYTSGTTGNPKGVLYTQRSTLLHAYASALPDLMNLSASDVILPVVPMFHVNAWGTPYSAPLVGAKLVFPGPALDGASLYQLFESERVTFTAGVPTVWQGLLQHLQKHRLKLTTVKRIVVGGAACPPALMQSFEQDYGVKVHHAWGMTELSPLGTYNTLKPCHAGLSDAARCAIELKQGRPPFGIELKITDDVGRELARDGKTTGDLLVRGAWVVQRYYGLDTDPLQDGWFPTGDVAHLDAHGYLQITDRSKDVIKSGGEWISSIELENAAMSHPAVAEAAVIGVKHPKWDERPLLVVVKKPGAEVTRDELIAHFVGRVAKWWIPDDTVFFAEIPHTATGKISKLHLREQLKDYRFPGAA
jgi:fatty-acyl-CoA synthase